MRAEPAPETAARPNSPLKAAERLVAERAAIFRRDRSEPSRGLLVDALMALATEAFRIGDDGVAAAALTEAEASLPRALPAEMPWPARVVNLHRAKGGLAQKQGRSADAVAAFEAALSGLPSDPTGDRDAQAARLQLLVRLSRSRLALGQGAEVAAEMGECEGIMASLAGAIPSRALDTVRAAVLGHLGAALALLGRLDEAETRFSASVALVDSLKNPDLAELKRQVLSRWASALRATGRAAEADALLAGSAPHAHVHDAACGHDHANSHHHAEGGPKNSD